MSYPDNVRMIKTNTGEVFFLVEPSYFTDMPRHWSLYLNERPELEPFMENTKIDGLAYRNKYITYKIGFGLEKAYYFSRDNHYDHFEEFNLYHPYNAGKHLNVFKTFNGDYYIADEYFEEYNNKKEFEFINRVWVMHDMLYFLKIYEGVYRELKKEYFVFADNENVYLVNCDYLSSWEKVKNKLHPNSQFHFLDIARTKAKDSLSPYYSENEIIRINYGIYKTRNIVPAKEFKKYIHRPPIHTQPEIITNKEQYYFDNPEFWCFQNIDGEQFIINKYFLVELLNDNEIRFQSLTFLYKKYFYAVQPLEYTFYKKGIFIKNKPIYVNP